jgi:hypothetical protein
MRPHARTQDLELQSLGDSVVVYDLANDRAHSLEPLAVRIWKLADGTRSVDDIVGALDEATVDVDAVWAALDALGDAGLLQERAGPPAGERRVSRRTLVRDIAAAGALGLAVPHAVRSILTPLPLAAQSGTGGGGSSEQADKEFAAKQAQEQSQKQAQAQAQEQAQKQAQEQAQKQAQEAEQKSKP